MSFIILFALAGALAYLVGRAWVIAVPPAVGFFVAGAIIGVGSELNDTPLPIAIAIATVAAALGFLQRRHEPHRGISS